MGEPGGSPIPIGNLYGLVVVVVVVVVVVLVKLVGPPPLLLAARAMPKPASPTPAIIIIVFLSSCAFFTPAGLPAGRVVAANAFVASKLAARMAAPKIRISFSISCGF